MLLAGLPPRTVLLAIGVAAIVALSPTPACAADAWRVAVLVGNNHGGPGRPALYYAEADVGRVADVLTEIGGFPKGDVHVLTGGSMAAVRAKLSQVKQQIAAHRARGGRTVLLFYFSGHSDGEGLELGTDRWAFASVRASLKDLGPDIRIAIVDSCQSGALLAAKGGTQGPTFDIRFTDDIATTGEAILTSSAAHERALESREIRASFFSHHFVSGLRGAADSSNDGRVTLAEAYRYAFVNTLLATSNTLAGPQHPAYDFRLSGQGELVLTEVLAHGSTLSLPSGFDRILVADAQRHYVLAELTATSAHRIALPAGRYVVQGRRHDTSYEAVVSLAQGERRALGRDDLRGSENLRTGAKGGDSTTAAILAASDAPDSPPPPDGLILGVGGIVARAAAEGVPLLSGAGLMLASARDSPKSFGWALDLQLATARSTGFRESAAYLGIGAFAAGVRGGWRATAGWRVSAGGVLQEIDEGGRSGWTLAVGTGPWLSASRVLTPRLWLFAGAGVEVRLMRGDVQPETLWPTGSFGVSYRL